MCYAIPAKITHINAIEDEATVDYGGIIKKVNISLVKAKTGDYVLIHAGFAIEKLVTKSAEETLELTRNI